MQSTVGSPVGGGLLGQSCRVWGSEGQMLVLGRTWPEPEKTQVRPLPRASGPDQDFGSRPET